MENMLKKINVISFLKSFKSTNIKILGYIFNCGNYFNLHIYSLSFSSLYTSSLCLSFILGYANLQ